MRLEHIIYDIKELLGALTDDTRVTDAFLIHKIGNYRSQILTEQFLQTGSIPASAFSRLPNKELTPVSSADFPELDMSSVKFGVVKIPKPIEFIGIKLPIRVMSSSRQQQFFPISLQALMNMIQSEDDRLNHFRYWIYEYGKLLVYKYKDNIDVLMVPEDPVDCFKVDSTIYNLTDLTNAISYDVISGSCVDNNGVVYSLYNTMVYNNSLTYTGDAKFRLTTTTMQITLTDEYPIDRDTAQKIVFRILTIDYNIERQAIADIFDDSADQAQRLKTGVGP